MPQLQTVDLSPIPRTKPTTLESTLSAFAGRHRENQVQQQEADELSKIYEQHQNDGQNIGKLIRSVQTNPNLSPTRRVETIGNALKMQENNAKLAQAAAKNLSTQQKAEAAAATAEEKRTDKEEKKARNLEQNNFIQQERGRKEGEGAAFVDNPKLYEQVTRPQNQRQSDQPVNEDQRKRIDHTVDQPGFNELSPSDQTLALIRNGVSKENTKAVVEPRIEQAKIEAKRGGKIAEQQAEADVKFYNAQMAQIPLLEASARTLDRAEELNEQGVTGSVWDQLMEGAGLLQFTSEGRREFASLAKDAVKNQNIKSVIGSQISQLEFGFFRDATINPNFSKEANRQVIKKERLGKRYEKLYADVTKNIVDENNGTIPVNFQAKVNTEFAKQAEKISTELKKVAKTFNEIQNVPKGHVLMYDEDRNPLHVPEDQAEQASKEGASFT